MVWIFFIAKENKATSKRNLATTVNFWNSTLGICNTWIYGEYYDFTFQQWRSWAGKCTGLCNYQTVWFEWAVGESLDVDTLSCVQGCSQTQLKISDAQFSVNSFCRTPNFYINPDTIEIIEMGSQKYPYKNLKSALSEILNYFSHKNFNITIFLKEGTRAYLQDSNSYLLNITSVTLKSYSDISSSPTRATLVPTKITQPSFDGNASFSIIKNAEMRLSAKIAEGTLTDGEKAFIGAFGTSFSVIRTGIYFYNINVVREAIDINWAGVLVHWIYLQDKWFDVRKIYSIIFRICNLQCLWINSLD